MKTVKIITHSFNLTLNIDQKTTIEDLIIETCKHLEIGPIARHLFFLRIKSTTGSIWLQLNLNAEKMSCKHLEFDVKRSYLDQFKQILPDYLCERFKACLTNYVDEPSAKLIVVDPYHSLHPGICIKYDLRGNFEHDGQSMTYVM